MSAMVGLLSDICALEENHSADPGGFLGSLKSLVGVHPWCWQFSIGGDPAASMASEKPVG